jgi:hypothetical protein
MKWTSEDVARKLKMESFDQSVIDTFKGILIFVTVFSVWR